MSASLQILSQKYDIGVETLADILEDLKRPGRDPRDDLAPPSFAAGVREITDLEIGMTLEGVVRNITDFGAFVDIGLHNDGLVHKSQLADVYVTHPMDVVKLGQAVTVRVLEIDLQREKVSLSMKNIPQAGGPSVPQKPVTKYEQGSARSDKAPEPSTPSGLSGNITFTTRK